MYLDYRVLKDFVGMDMCRKFLEMGFTRGLDDMLITKTARNMIKTVKYYHKRKIGTTSEKAKSAKDLKNLEI